MRLHEREPDGRHRHHHPSDWHPTEFNPPPHEKRGKAETRCHTKRGGRHENRRLSAESFAATGHDLGEFHRPQVEKYGKSPEKRYAEGRAPQRHIAPQISKIQEMAGRQFTSEWRTTLCRHPRNHPSQRECRDGESG